jgi:hypothetical protein
MSNVRFVLQTAIKYTHIFHSKALQNIPKLGFLYEFVYAIWQPCRDCRACPPKFMGENVKNVFANYSFLRPSQQ